MSLEELPLQIISHFFQKTYLAAFLASLLCHQSRGQMHNAKPLSELMYRSFVRLKGEASQLHFDLEG